MGGAGPARPRVFLSYRRHDSKHLAGRIADRLAQVVGADRLFMDVSTIRPGDDFHGSITSAVAGSDLLIALVGPAWAGVHPDTGLRRLDDPGDLVVHEIGTAFEHDIPVIPVLADGAGALTAVDLPEPIRKLSRLHAVRIDHESFESDIRPLLQIVTDFERPPTPVPGPAVESAVEPPKRPPPTSAPAPPRPAPAGHPDSAGGTSTKRWWTLGAAAVAGLGLVAALLVALPSFGGSPGSGQSPALEPVKIGFLGNLTGENSGLVIPPRNGAMLAIGEYNATNPAQKLELLEYDSQGSTDLAVQLVTRAIQQEDIVGLIGPSFSGESAAVGPLLEQGGIPSVSPSASSPGLAENGWRFWHRVVASDAEQGPAIADFLVRTASPRKAFVIADDSQYGGGLADAMYTTFQARGVAVERDQFAQATSDYSSIVAKVNAAQPDVVVFGGYYAQAGRLLRQLRDAGVTAIFASGDGALDPGLIASAGDAVAAEGALAACSCLIPQGATGGRLSEFTERYRTEFQTDPASYAVEGYDAASLFIGAIKGGAATPDAINTAISGTAMDGVSKRISFAPNGELTVGVIFVYQVKGGEFRLLGPSTEAVLS